MACDCIVVCCSADDLLRVSNRKMSADGGSGSHVQAAEREVVCICSYGNGPHPVGSPVEHLRLIPPHRDLDTT